jgi:hypothetical protein
MTEILCLACGFHDYVFFLYDLAPLVNVCMYWRSVIAGFANFWRHVEILVYTAVTPPLEAGVISFLGIMPRSFSITLLDSDVEIKSENGRFPHGMAPLPFLRAILRHVKKLEIKSVRQCMNNVFDPTWSLHNQLEDLEFSSDCDCDLRKPLKPFILPRLRRLTTFHVNLEVMANNLVYLRLYKGCSTMIHSALSSCPNVEEVEVWVDRASISNDALPPIILRCVKRLHMLACAHGVQLVRALRLPTVQRLTIKSIGGTSMELTTDVIVDIVGAGLHLEEFDVDIGSSSEKAKFNKTFRAVYIRMRRRRGL